MNKIKKVFMYFIIILLLCVILISLTILFINLYNKNKKYYLGEDFGIETLKSKTDYDNDGIDDYRDILEGAKIEANNKPKYKSEYYEGGYPPDNEGVCTDVIWRALKNAGYI